jgi:hypothetical protein
VRTFDRNGRNSASSTALAAVTSEQIEVYTRFCAEVQNREIKTEKAAQQTVKDAKGAKKKKTKVRKHRYYTTEDESLLALAQAVGDHRVKRAGVIESKRRY